MTITTKNKNYILKKLRSKTRLRSKVKYITEFPYTVKRNFLDILPQWKVDTNSYPRFESRKWDDINIAYVIQDKNDGTVYNWFNNNLIDGYRTTDRDKRWLEDEVMPRLKANEDELPYRILGWGWGFKPIGCKQFQRAGDQFIKFFDEDGIEYYYDECVYEHDWDEDDKEELKEDYSRKTYEYWDEWNYTNENLGVKP